MYKVYWTNPHSGDAHSADFETLTEALQHCEQCRRVGSTFVTMASENPSNVGKAGASGVVDGKLPSGEQYSWSKNDRVGVARRPALSTDNLEVDLDDPR